MTMIKYVNSGGETVDFVGEMLRARDGNLHIRSWEPNATKNRKNGYVVKSFGKKPAEYKIKLTLRGDLEDRKKELDRICEVFEKDVIKNVPGKIFFGEYYINAYIISSDTHISDDINSRSDDDMVVYCPYPFWCRDKKYSFSASERAIEDAENKNEINHILENTEITPDYKYEYPIEFLCKYRPAMKRPIQDYPFDYYHNHTIWKLDNDHFTESGFKMIIYGPCTHPFIQIGQNIYEVNDSLSDGEYMVIDSRQRAVVKYARNGVVEDIFNKRSREHSVFQKIPSGKLTVKWNAQYPFDVILFQERSEPPWSTY